MTQVCTGIRQNESFFKTGHSLLISILAQHITTQLHTFCMLASEPMVTNLKKKKKKERNKRGPENTCRINTQEGSRVRKA